MGAWVDHEQAAVSAGVTTRTIRRWVHDGKLTTRNQGREIDQVSLERIKSERRHGHLLRKLGIRPTLGI